MKNCLIVEFPDRSIFQIPIGIIALNRAEYYAIKEGGDDAVKYSTIFEEEYQYTLGDPTELIDWASNNMNWSDIEDYAIQETTKGVDFNEEWASAIKSVLKEN